MTFWILLRLFCCGSIYKFDLKSNGISKRKKFCHQKGKKKLILWLIIKWSSCAFVSESTTTPKPTDDGKRNKNFFKNFKNKKMGWFFVLKMPNENHVKIFLFFSSPGCDAICMLCQPVTSCPGICNLCPSMNLFINK